VRNCTLIILLLACVFTQAQSPLPQQVNAPFKSWANVKQRFGAIGDGRQDDTKALQRALDGLTDYRFGVNTDAANAYTVVYLPKGTYRITGTLNLTNKIGVSIIGEDPENTTIVWDGPSRASALYCNGASYFKIARIQWNARSNGSTGIAIRWTEDKNSANSYAPQMIEIAECVFRSFAQGIAGGVFQQGEQDATNSEVSIRNCHFYNCTDAGIAIAGYNALDYWIWNCRFLQCNIGVKNRFGNYHIYRSYFKKSAVADVHNHHGYYTSIRKCYSDSSKYFSFDDGFSCNYFIRVIEGNYVKNSIDFPVEYCDYGYVTLVDNYFFKNANATWPFTINIVQRNDICPQGPYKIFSFRNYYEINKPLRINRVLYQQHDYTINDYGFGKTRPAIREQAFIDSILIPFSKEVQATVFEVPRGASTDAIQQLINAASGPMHRGRRPILHFSTGTYYIDKPLVFPANSDVQVKGDGFMYATRIYQSKNFKGKYLFEIKGPSNVSVADLHLGTEGLVAPNGINVSAIDQPGSSVLIDQMVSGPAAHAIVALNLLETYVQKTNSYYAYNDSIVGSAAAGRSQVHLFGGQFGFASISGNVTYLAKDCWFEWAKDTAAVFSLQGPGRVILDACRIASSHPASTPFVRTGKFTGLLALMNVYTDNFLGSLPETPTHELFVMNSSTERLSGNLRSPKTAKSKVALLGMTVRKNQQNQADIRSAGPEVAAFMSRVQSYSAGKLPRPRVTANNKNSNVFFTRVSFGNVREAFRLNAK